MKVQLIVYDKFCYVLLKLHHALSGILTGKAVIPVYVYSDPGKSLVKMYSNVV